LKEAENFWASTAPEKKGETKTRNKAYKEIKI
jgi:hypothetical protein